MSNKKHSPTSEQALANTSSEPIDKSMSDTSRHKLMLGIMALLVIIIIASFFYLRQQLAKSTAQWQATLMQAQQQLNNAQQQLQQQQQSLTTAQTSLDKQQSQLDSQQETLQSLAKATGRTDKDWILAEADYLLRLANMNLDLEQRPDIAIKMLQNADLRIASLADPSLTTVRRAIANDVAALQAVPHVDLEALILQMQALNDQIEQLPLISPRMQYETDRGKDLNQIHAHGWRAKLQDSLKELHQIVIIRRHDQPIEPLLSPEQQIYLTQNLHVMLEQAQWAAIRQKEAVYQNSLQRAQDWIKRFFDQRNPKTQAVLNALAQLQSTDVNPPLPSIADSLQILQQIIDQNRANQHAADDRKS